MLGGALFFRGRRGNQRDLIEQATAPKVDTITVSLDTLPAEDQHKTNLQQSSGQRPTVNAQQTYTHNTEHNSAAAALELEQYEVKVKTERELALMTPGSWGKPNAVVSRATG